MKQNDGRSISHEVLEAYRYRAIELYQKGKSVQEIAFFFGIHRGSVSLWIKTWKEKGKSGLKSRKALGPDFKLGKDNRSNSVAAGIKMEFTIFDGLSTYSRIQQAQADYRKIEYQKNQLIDGIKMEIKQSELRMKEAQEQIETQRQNVIQSEKALKIAEVRYNNGIGTQLELFDAQLILEQAQMGHIKGIYDYLIAKTDWERAIGL